MQIIHEMFITVFFFLKVFWVYRGRGAYILENLLQADDFQVNFENFNVCNVQRILYNLTLATI